MILDTACFHCQQAIEKSLKGYLFYKGYDIEKTHDINFLLSKCSQIDPVFYQIDPMNLNDYAVLGRYPDDSLMPEYEEAKAYYELAILIKNIVKERIVFE